MPGLIKNRALLLAEVEVTYGTDPTPAEATDAVLVQNVQHRPVLNQIQREVLGGTLSKLGAFNGGKYSEITFDVELKHSGTADTPPDLGVLLKGCAFQETINAATSVVYTPRSTGIESITIYYFVDGLRYRMTGCRGNVTLNASAAGLPLLSFTFQGLYNAPTDTALPASPVFQSTVPKPFVNAAFDIGGDSLEVANFSFDMQNNVAPMPSANGAEGFREILITNRNPTGRIDPEAELIATHDFWAFISNSTQQALTCTFGTGAGETITVTAPNVVYTDLNDGDREGGYIYDMTVQYAQNTGDDELVITCT